MRRLAPLLPFACACLLLLSIGCHRKIGEPDDSQELMRPQDVVAFDRLYRQNCSACHGESGRDGPALDLANPKYQALVDDASLKHWITAGMAGTQMPAFGESAGGLLTEKQVDVLVEGMRRNWSVPNQQRDTNMPPYAANVTGDVARGGQVYQTACVSCHERKQQITNTSYLALTSDQALRTIIIAGRPDLGHPDWQSRTSGHALSNQDVTDVVTYLGSLRSATPGQPYPDRENVQR